MRPIALAVAIVFAGCGRSAPAAKDATTAPEAKLIGTTPPEWHLERWLNAPPITVASLRGSVVLVRWWTAGCPYCSTSAPALRTLDREYGARGLKAVSYTHLTLPTSDL